MFKKTCALVLAILMSFSLCGCASKAAKAFDKEVNAVSILDNPSESDISYLKKAYEALSPTEKTEIKNYDLYKQIVESYELRIKSEEINQTIEKYNTNIQSVLSSNDYHEILSLLVEISGQDQEIINNLVGIEDLRVALIDTSYSAVMAMNNSDLEEMYETISYMKDYYTHDQLLECMKHYAVYDGYEHALDYLKSKLKNPRSLKVYDVDVRKMGDPLGDGGYTTWYDIEYGATNSFGGEVENSMCIKMKVFFNLDELAVDYAYVGDGGPSGIDHVIADPTPGFQPKT